MTHGRYIVTGNRQYRGHPKGTIFEARLDPLAEQRAIARGSIALLERVEPTIQNTTYQLPQDWPPPRQPVRTQTEAPKGASLVRGGERT